jgi:type II secretory pathway pseudopilin PulG
VKSYKILAKSSAFSGGLTLVEVLVGLLLFSVIMLVAIGAIVTMIDANRKSRAQKTVGTSLNAALESMTRAIRDGSVYHCDLESDLSVGIGVDIAQDCPDPVGSTVFAYEPKGGDPSTPADQVVYKLGGALNTSVMRSTDGGTNFLALTPPEVVVNDLTFRTISYGATDEQEQPKILITLAGTVGGQDGTQASFSVQTTVSQRFKDFATAVVEKEVGGWPQSPKCPFVPRPGRTIVDTEGLGSRYYPDLVLYSLTLFRGPYVIPVPIEGGYLYNVLATTYEDHCDSLGQNCIEGEPYEQLYIELRRPGTILWTSIDTPDIPEDENQPIWTLNDADLRGLQDATQIKLIHSPSGTNSVNPGCFAFDRVSDVQEF